MAAVQHTPSNESRRSKAFMESMEEEMRRCSEHLQRRQSKRSTRPLNGYARSPDDMNSGEEAGARSRRKFANTLPRSFSMSSNPETRDLPFTRRKNHSPSNRSPRTPTIKAPIGATVHHETFYHGDRDQQRTPDYRGRSAPPDSTTYTYHDSSSSSELSYGSSRESSITPLGMAPGLPRSSSASPRSSLSPPPVAPKPNGRSREKAWSNVRRSKMEESPKIIRALPESRPNSEVSIPVSNQPINLPISPMEFPSADIDIEGFKAQTPPLKINSPEAEPLETTSKPITDNNHDPVFSEGTTHSVEPQPSPTEQIPTESTDQAVLASEPLETRSESIGDVDKPQETTLAHQGETEFGTALSEPKEMLQPKETTTAEPQEAIPAVVGESINQSTECVHNKPESHSMHSPAEKVEEGQSLSELNAPEVKSIPKKVRHKSSSRENSPKEVLKRYDGSPGKRRHSRTHSESKIHITVSAKSVNVPGASKHSNDTNSDEMKSREFMDETVAAMLSDLQTKLQQKDDELIELRQQHEKALHDRNEQIRKQARENKKIEREKWELLKRARDAAERALHLRTQLDMKEATVRSTQSELDRTKDELYSVKSANTSLRALLSELRAPHQKTGVEVGVQVDLGGGTLKRNKSIELAFAEGGLSEKQQENTVLEGPSSDFRASTTSLSRHWPERSYSDKWDRADSTSLNEDIPMVTMGGMSASQPAVPWSELKKPKRKHSLRLGGKLKRSSGSKRGSNTSMDGLDMSNSSILHGTGLRGTAPVTFPYHAVPTDMKGHWRVLEQAQGVSFFEWNLPQVIAWLEADLGMNQYSEAVRDKAPSGAALLSLSDSELDKKLGISHPLHRRKLRLALEEQRLPDSCQYPHARKIDHAWVAYEWAHDCGLAHLTEILTNNLVDGRLLNTLTKEDIRKYLKINKKTDQLSFLSAVELLRMHEFNRQAIQKHRETTNNPLYWTNRDVCDWLKEIRLEEYATNVIGGGVHGALLFLERSNFTSDHLASIIQIPSSKGQLKRHLAGKMARLFTEDVTQSVESIPSHTLMAGSPSQLSGSQSPDRRPLHSPRHGSGTPPPVSDFHPSRRNSLQRGAVFESLTLPAASSPRGFARTSSGPSPRQQRISQVAAAERVRLSLRESALRSVSSINEETTPPVRSFTPTLANSSGTTV